jgi:hypothetical protein
VKVGLGLLVPFVIEHLLANGEGIAALESLGRAPALVAVLVDHIVATGLRIVLQDVAGGDGDGITIFPDQPGFAGGGFVEDDTMDFEGVDLLVADIEGNQEGIGGHGIPLSERGMDPGYPM